MSRTRNTTIVAVRGGCNRCTRRWDGQNALAMAARHHDRTQHQTWAEQTQRTVYGGALGKTAARAQKELL